MKLQRFAISMAIPLAQMLLRPLGADGQQHSPTLYRTVSPTPLTSAFEAIPLVTFKLSSAGSPASIVRLGAGGIVGGLVGFGIGGAVGAASSGEGLGGIFIGAVLGQSVGVPAGVNIANRGRGNLAPALLLSTALGVLGILALDRDVIEAGAFYAVVAPLQLATSIILERKTSRQKPK
ncbi:MAG: hypothetical protein WKF55_13445 [Gemmatimonadaceae bacterium]